MFAFACYKLSTNVHGWVLFAKRQIKDIYYIYSMMVLVYPYRVYVFIKHKTFLVHIEVQVTEAEFLVVGCHMWYISNPHLCTFHTLH